jgi:subtilisin family serine protease
MVQNARAWNASALRRMGLWAWGDGLDGRGILIGFLDYGFDVLHPALCDARGRTRFAALLDQNRGAEFDSAALQGLIREARAAGSRGPLDRIYDPHAYHFGPLEPLAAHGTLMASIAAGGGWEGYRGPAPAACLIGVQLALHDDDWKEEDSAGLPAWTCWRPERQPVWDGWRSYDDAPAIADGLEYLWERARQLRADGLVINLSIGACAGARDGRSRVERKIAELAARSADGEGPPCAVVVAAGNAGAEDGHFGSEVSPGRPVDFEWRMLRRQRRQKKLELWYRFSRPLRIALSLAGHAGREGDRLAACTVEPGPTVSIEAGGTRIGIADHCHCCRGDLSRLRLLIHPARVPGCDGCAGELVAHVRLSLDAGAGPAEAHAWIEREDDPREKSSLFPSHPEFTISPLAAAAGAIAVAAYDHHSGHGPGALAYSSLGPVPWAPSRQGAAPLLAAPGHRLWGARSKSSGFIETSGTSAAAALTSGALALLMQRETQRGRRFDSRRAGEILLEAAAGDAALRPHGCKWGPRWGYGPIDAEAWRKEIAA